MSRARICFCLFVVLLAACGGGSSDTSPGGVTPSPDPTAVPEPVPTEVIVKNLIKFEALAPNPLIVTLQLDETKVVSAVITTSGGSLSAAAADGSSFNLEIPADALLSDQLITMTPLAGVEGLELEGGYLAGVKLAPEGLLLFREATLTITTAAAYPLEDEISFGVHGDDNELVLYPVQVDVAEPTFKLNHFSAYFVGQGSAQDRGELQNRIPSRTRDQFIHQLQTYLGRERHRQLAGADPDPDFWHQVESFYGSYFEQALQPMIAQAMTSDDWQFICRVITEVLQWERQRQLLLGGDSLNGMSVNDAITSLMARFTGLRMKEAEQICSFDPQAGLQIALGLARQAAVMGIEIGTPVNIDQWLKNCRPPKLYFQSRLKDHDTSSRGNLLEIIDQTASSVVELRFDPQTGGMSGEGILSLDVHQVFSNRGIGGDDGGKKCAVSWNPTPSTLGVTVTMNFNIKGCEEYRPEVVLNLKPGNPKPNIHFDCRGIEGLQSGPEEDLEYAHWAVIWFWSHFNDPYGFGVFKDWILDLGGRRLYMEFDRCGLFTEIGMCNYLFWKENTLIEIKP